MAEKIAGISDRLGMFVIMILFVITFFSIHKLLNLNENLQNQLDEARSKIYAFTDTDKIVHIESLVSF